jgi:hypothetical protein
MTVRNETSSGGQGRFGLDLELGDLLAETGAHGTVVRRIGPCALDSPTERIADFNDRPAAGLIATLTEDAEGFATECGSKFATDEMQGCSHCERRPKAAWCQLHYKVTTADPVGFADSVDRESVATGFSVLYDGASGERSSTVMRSLSLSWSVQTTTAP